MLFKIKNIKQSQLGFEFLILTVFLLILMSSVLGVTGYFISQFNEADLDQEREEFAQTILSEFENAKVSENRINRSFNITPADLKKFNISFYDVRSYFTIIDIRKDGEDSDRLYYYTIGEDFRLNETFYINQAGSGSPIKVLFSTTKNEEEEFLDLTQFNIS